MDSSRKDSPADEIDKEKMDELLRRMLKTPPKPRQTKRKDTPDAKENTAKSSGDTQ
jgi:hypothetical protein